MDNLPTVSVEPTSWQTGTTPPLFVLVPPEITGTTFDGTDTATVRLRRKQGNAKVSEFTLTWNGSSGQYEKTPSLAESSQVPPGDYFAAFRLEKEAPELRLENTVDDIKVEESRF